MMIDLFNKQIPLILALIALFSFVLSYGLVLLFRIIAKDKNILDIPSQRSSHEEPTPRGGGIALVISFAVLFPVIQFYYLKETPINWGLYISCIAISLLGFIDDLTTLSKRIRILTWVGITILALFAGVSFDSINIPIIGTIEFGILSPLTTFFWLIGLTNLFNFMDGINGLAGLEALIVSGFLAGIALFTGNLMIFVISTIVFGSVLGFLPHNFPIAKVFMGDVGSNFLGFLFAALALIGNEGDAHHIPFLVPVILLMMFLLDAGTTLLRRLPKGKDWLKPHRDHYYQRLIILGYSHSQVTFLYSFFNLILGFLAVTYIKSDGLLSLLVAIASLFPFLVVVILTKIPMGKD